MHFAVDSLLIYIYDSLKSYAKLPKMSYLMLTLRIFCIILVLINYLEVKL